MQDAKNQAYSGKMFVWYMIYNGGNGINIEISKARKDLGIIEVPHDIARKYCSRNKLIYNKTACEINYEYPLKIYEYSKKYKIGDDGKYKFW